jgi:hypothetical protein
LWCELCGAPAPCSKRRCAEVLAALAGRDDV